MRTAGRVLLAGADTGVAAQLGLARAAEAHGLDGVWIGGRDSFATTAAVSAAAATRFVRIGVVLTLDRPGDVLRLAEDLAVLDHCSGGRAEICLDGRPGGPGWVDTAGRLLANLRGCEVDGRELAVTPGPLQPTIPALVRGPAGVPGTGPVAELDSRPAPGPTAATENAAAALWIGADRTAALLADIHAALPGAANSVGVADLLTAMGQLRDAVQRHGARDVVLTAPPATLSDDVALLASVAAPVLRAAEEEVPDLLLDTLAFRRAATASR